MSNRNDESHESATPTKRPRLMAHPDGFSKSKATPVSKSSIPKFSSGFDTPPPVKRPLKTKEAPKVLKPPDSGSGARNPGRHVLRALKPPVPLSGFESKPLDHPLPAPPRMPPLPSFSPATSKPPALRPLAPPPPPPPPIASSSRVTTPLKPLVPPPPPPSDLLVSSERELRTISTTLLARATDLFTDNGPSELASMFFHNQHPDILTTPDDVDEHRGIMVSPEKSSKGKEKFARNGLAARAAALYERSYSSLALWEAEMAHSLASSRRGLNPDLRFRIIYILHTPSPLPQPSSKSSLPGVALCHLLSAPSGDALGASLPRSKDGICAVLFSFASLSPPAHPQAPTELDPRNPEDFAEGKEVYVWKPWQGLVVDVSALTLCVNAAADTDPEAETDPAFDLFEPGAAGALRRGSISEMALLCERFVVLK